MKIAFDGQLFLKGQKTGISWLAHNVLVNLSHDALNTYELNCFTLGYSEDSIAAIDQYGESGYEIHKVSWFHDIVYRAVSNYLPIPYSFFFGKDADVNVFFNYIIPPGVKGKTIVFVHDMGYKVYPETVKFRTRKLLEVSLEQTCRKADKIVTISEFSKREIMKFFSIEAERIGVVTLGVDRELYHPGYGEKQIQQVKQKYGIEEEYFLYLGTIEPRKNLERLIRAYGELVKEREHVPQLILAGKDGWNNEAIYAAVDELNLQNRAKFIGYVETEDSPKLLCGALAFVFPSLYEGFGLPPLEAMTCGCPVITSNTASLPEVVGEAGILVDPKNVGQIKDAMRQMMDSQEVREKYRQLGLEQEKKFDWAITARQLEKLF